jgi:hypothetical protein
MRIRNIAAAGVLVFGSSFATIGAVSALAVPPPPGEFNQCAEVPVDEVCPVGEPDEDVAVDEVDVDPADDVVANDGSGSGPEVTVGEPDTVITPAP